MNRVLNLAGFWDVCSGDFSAYQTVMMFKWGNKYKNTVWYIKQSAECGGDSGVIKSLWSGQWHAKNHIWELSCESVWERL